MTQAYGQLLDNATTLWAERTGWFPGKWATVAILRSAARDPNYQAHVAAKFARPVRGFGDEPAPEPPPPTLADLVAAAFDMVLLIYGPSLPFGGYWVRAAKGFVLQYLNLLFVPAGLAYRPK